MLGQFYPCMKILACYTDPYGIKNKKNLILVIFLIPYWYQKIYNPHYKNDIKKKMVAFHTDGNHANFLLGIPTSHSLGSGVSTGFY